MKKQLLLFAMMLLPMVASAHDIEVQNGDGVTIYYNYINENTELEVTFRGSSYREYSNRYTGNVAIPEEVTFMNRTRKVTRIGESAFYNCSDLTSITIPNSVTIIDQFAFFGCYNLTSVTIPNSVTSIGYHAFTYCFGLTSLTIPNSVTSIGVCGFDSCKGLTSINVESGNPKYDSRGNCNAIIKTASNTLILGCKNTVIPNSVTSIDGGAFRSCSGLTSITIPNSVTSIGQDAFRGCSGLTSITIPNSVTSIKPQTFEGCSGLTSVSIPNSVTSIDGGAFRSCSGLTSITIPNSVTSIGSQAFWGCDIPTVISLIENPFAIEGKSTYTMTFSLNTFINATLYVPKGTIEKYKATDGWKDFMFIEEGVPDGINVVKNTKNNNTTIYDLNGVLQPEPKKGINIVNGKKFVVK